MELHKTTLERAFELASSGKCRSVAELVRRLNHEGYLGFQLQGPALHLQLKHLIKRATPSPEGNSLSQSQ